MHGVLDARRHLPPLDVADRRDAVALDRVRLLVGTHPHRDRRRPECDGNPHPQPHLVAEGRVEGRHVGTRPVVVRIGTEGERSRGRGGGHAPTVASPCFRVMTSQRRALGSKGAQRRLVAFRRHLPDLPPILRRLRRGRHWRSPGHHGAPRRPRRPRRGCGLAVAVHDLAAERRGLRRRRLLRRRPDLRHPRRRRRAHRPRPRARMRIVVDLVPKPLLERAPVVPGGARRRPRLRGARPLPVPAREGRVRRTAAEQLAVGLSAAPPGPASPRPTARPARGTSTSSTRRSPTSTGRTRGCTSGFREILRFWLDRDVDGFRVDVAHGLVKAEGLPDYTPGETGDMADRTRPTGARMACTRSTATGTGCCASTATTPR